jgi:hypothetical protein
MIFNKLDRAPAPRRDRLIVSVGQSAERYGGHDQSVPAELLDIQIKLLICIIASVIHQEMFQGE